MLWSLLSSSPQDWSAFCELAGSIAARLDRGEVGEAEATELLRPAAFYSMLREMIFLRHRPDVIRPLLRIFRLPGESEAAATARWRGVAVSRRRGCDVGYSSGCGQAWAGSAGAAGM
jgi:hypothetical protein